MVETRSQAGNITVKKEEEEEDCKPALGLMNVRNTRSSGKITKSKEPITNNRRLPSQQVKLEEDTDTKALLKPTSNHSKIRKGQKISQQQINQLIDYIVNDNMSVTEASCKVNISPKSGGYYYNVYNTDPEKRIPLPRDQNARTCTQEQIGNLITYINSDKMTLTEASAKAKMDYDAARRYYKKYLEDPNHNIPVSLSRRHYTQDQKNEFIDYIINDKMNITAASKKTKISPTVAHDYYHKYFKIENPDIATPSHIATHKRYTEEQINKLISYIVDDNMSIRAASRKANFCSMSAGRYYRQYLNDSNIKFPVTRKTYSQDDINKFIGYIVDDKMSINAASKKANMHEWTGKKYYRQYLKDRRIYVPTRKHITQEQKSELIGYIVDGKMSITAASKKANMAKSTGHTYYHQYLNAQNRSRPARCPRATSVSKNKE